MAQKRVGLLLLAILCVSVSLHADTIVTFEGFADSTGLTNQIPGLTFSQAIILTSGVSLNELEFPPHSGVNVVSDSGGPITIDFASPVLSAGGYFTYATSLNMTAYDASLTSLGSISSLFTSNTALSGAPGSAPNEFLSLSYGAGISRLTIQGDPAGGSFVLDDLTYSTATTAVPEPATLSLLCAGLLLIASVQHRRSVALKRCRARA